MTEAENKAVRTLFSAGHCEWLQVHAGKCPWRDMTEWNINETQHFSSLDFFFLILHIAAAGMLSSPETHMRMIHKHTQSISNGLGKVA